MKNKWMNDNGEEMTPQELLTKALVLGLIAPDVPRADRATELAEEFAAELSPEDVEVCKDAALMIFEHTLSEHNMERILH
jgi:hypothetical protein